MTELMQQIVELSQQYSIYTTIVSLLISGGVIAFVISAGFLMKSLEDARYDGEFRGVIIWGIILGLSVGCVIVGAILAINADKLAVQIEMLKYQLDNVIPILPMK